MKKLISVAEVEQAIADQKKSICIDANTIVTPAAKDFAKNKGICFSSVDEKGSQSVECGVVRTDKKSPEGATVGEVNPHSELVELVKSMLLEKLGGGASSIDGLLRCKDAGSGFQIVRPHDVEFDVFDTGIEGSKVFYKELVGYADSPRISCGLLKIIESEFPWKLLYDEMDIVLEGEVSLTINGKTYKAKAGDVIYVPENSEVIWGADEYAKLFYVTYPANWAETMA